MMERVGVDCVIARSPDVMSGRRGNPNEIATLLSVVRDDKVMRLDW